MTPSRHHIITLAVAAMCSAGASAMDVEHTASRYVDKKYQFELVAMLDAPPERVEAVLRDYADYPKLDERILDAKVLERPEEFVVILATTVRACFGPFCRNVKRVERVEESPFALLARADPERSDVRFGETHTQLAAAEGKTRVTYRISTTPGFWIPALVGRRWMLATLEDATMSMFESIETTAKTAPPADSGPHEPRISNR